MIDLFNNLGPLRQIERPAEIEYGPASAKYIQLVPSDPPVLELLKTNAQTITKLFLSLDQETLLYRYAAGKWSMKEVLVHLVDDERIYAYRALRFARNDGRVLGGFDQDAYAAESAANERPLPEILKEYQVVRLSTLLMYNGFPDKALTRSGSTNEFTASVGALLFHIAGHEINHLKIIREHYLGE